MLRETTSSLEVWDIAGRSRVTLGPGSLLSRCRIQHHSQAEVDLGADAYDVEFQADGRKYFCPLVRFQPRTQAVELVSVKLSAHDAVAV